ncbi:hypothetical protein C8J56DRAFT_807964, partial [Mycena floridula]
CPLKKLYGISAIGTKLCFYEFETKQDGAAILPKYIPHDRGKGNDSAPADRWDCDILDPIGEQGLREIVKKIKEESVVLED